MKIQDVLDLVAQTIHDNGFVIDHGDFNKPYLTNHTDKPIREAMQTYHDEGCVEFAEWVGLSGYVRANNRHWVNSMGESYTTTELLKLWKDEKGIV